MQQAVTRTSPPSVQSAPVRGRLRHIPELDGVRGLAALVVVFYHAGASMFHPVSLAAWGMPVRWTYRVFNWGWTGVDLFFVLSGFLITSILIEERNSPRYYQDFYWKRALRILPLYVLCLLGNVLFKHEYGYVLLAAVFLVNFASVVHVEGSGPYWSLAIEEQFYLLWPTVVRRARPETLMRWSVALGVFCILLRLLFASRGHYNHYLSFLRCDGLAFGAGLACFYRRSAQAPRRSPATGLLLGLLALGLCLLWCAGLLPSAAYAAAVTKTGVTLVCGTSISLIVIYSGSRALGLLRSRVLVFFGLLSYAIYMLHTYVIEAWNHYAAPLAEGDDPAYWMRLAGCLAISVLLAFLSRHVIELPAMRLRKYVLSHPSGHKAETGSTQLPLARMD